MRIVSHRPHPYLLNQAGGICRVKEFRLVNGELSLVPADEKPNAGTYELVYRCPEHETSDVKLTIASDGESWSLTGPPPPGGDPDVCFPGPSN